MLTSTGSLQDGTYEVTVVANRYNYGTWSDINNIILYCMSIQFY